MDDWWVPLSKLAHTTCAPNPDIPNSSETPGIAARVHARALERSTLNRYYMWLLGFNIELLGFRV